MIAVSPVSAAGGAVELSGDSVYYTLPTGFLDTDTFVYVVSDGHCRGIGSGLVTVTVQPDSSAPSPGIIENLGNGSFKVTFSGVPGLNYRIQYSANLSGGTWVDLGSQEADFFGQLQIVDTPPFYAPARFYRSVCP